MIDNNKGFWCENENKDKSIIATQLFFSIYYR